MATAARKSVHDANQYRPPEITGLTDVLDQHVRDRPDAPALVVTADRITVSYSALAAVVDDVATRLAGAGLRRGDVVGLRCANTPEFVVALLGAAQAGLVVAPLDPALPQSELSARLERLGARVLFAGPHHSADAQVVQFQNPTWDFVVDVTKRGIATATVDIGAGTLRRGQGAASQLSNHDALVLFTSGTTAHAKMVPLTHANVAASVQRICGSYDLGPEDATVAVMPLFHGHGLLAVLLASLASGGCVLLPELGRFAAHTFWDDMCAVAATWFTAVPTIHQILLQRSAREYPGRQVVPLRFVRSCSAPLNTATAQAVAATLGVPLLSAYGMTETTHQATSEPLPGRAPVKCGSVGRGTGVDIRIVDKDGHACAAGGMGEVWVRGPSVARGYLADPVETARSFVDGWFRTGDLGYRDEDGYLFLTGRIKNLIIRGGEKISPEHVEEVLSGCRGVVEAAVFAIPDATYGERVGAVVIVGQAESVGPLDILASCRSRLAPFEVPDQLEVVANLPHTAKGALDRRAVEQQYTH
jgi:acyl-CoA synthetase (AMP-forming)/AMP-acid ligase II